MLVHKEAGQQCPVYCLSKMMLGSEIRYAHDEQLILVLVMAVRKLRPYFQAHIIIILTTQPLYLILVKPDILGRMMWWSIKLNEFE